MLRLHSHMLEFPLMKVLLESLSNPPLRIPETRVGAVAKHPRVETRGLPTAAMNAAALEFFPVYSLLVTGYYSRARGGGIFITKTRNFQRRRRGDSFPWFSHFRAFVISFTVLSFARER